jgi:hypothetical protein
MDNLISNKRKLHSDENVLVHIVRYCRDTDDADGDGIREVEMYVPFKYICKGDAIDIPDKDTDDAFRTTAYAAEDASYSKARAGGWFVPVACTGQKEYVLKPDDFAPWLVTLSVVFTHGSSCKLFFECVERSEEKLWANIHRIFDDVPTLRHELGFVALVRHMARKYLTPDRTEPLGFRFLSDDVVWSNCKVKDILPDRFFAAADMELTFYAYAEDEYAESPLFFAKLPYLGTHHGTPAGCVICASILRKLDELYGDLPTETSRWSLEYQLWARMLLTEGAVMLNPMHLALYEDEHTFNSLVFCDDALEVSGDAIVWKKASGAPSNKITEAWEKETEKSGCNDTFTCAI